MQSRKWGVMSAVLGLGALTASNVAYAEEPTVTTTDEVVVTGARLRQEAVQNVPVAVTVINAATVEAQHATNIVALSSLAPNLSIGTNSVSPGVPTISLRGFSTRNGDISTEPGVPVYIDGVYQSLITGSMSDLFDVESVEVLRGPQGTLLGKNASAGAILINRTRPKMRLGGKASVEYGSFDLIQAQGLINVPVIADTLAVKLYGNYRHRSSWVHNTAVPGGDLGGEDRSTLRGALLWRPTSNVEVYLTADYLRDRSEQPGQRLVADPSQVVCGAFGLCGPDLGLRHTTQAGFLADPASNENNVAGHGKWDLGGATLTSISGYRNYKQILNDDADSTPNPILHLIQLTKTHDLSQELRLTSNDGAGLDMDGKLSWLVAGYYGRANSSQSLTLLAFGGLSTADQRSKRETAAVYGHADYQLTPKLEASVGVRRSADRTEHDYSLREPGARPPAFVAAESRRFHNTSFEAGARYQFTPDQMVFVRYAEGYRSGGFVGLPTSVANAAAYDPESSTAYEAGAKTDWLNGRLRLNLTLFSVTFDDLQRDIVRRNPDGTFTEVTQNAASARTRGVEFESVIRPVEGFTIRANVGYLDAKYLNYRTLDGAGRPLDLSNRPLLLAPKYTGSIDADYAFKLARFPLFDSGDLRAGVDWRSSATFSASDDPIGYQKGYATVNAALTLRSEAGGFKVSAYVQNVFDTDFKTGGETVGGLFRFISDDIGRTAGVLLEKSF